MKSFGEDRSSAAGHAIQSPCDPGADGQSVYDLQDDEAREREEARPVPPWKLTPDSNAM